MAARPLKGVSCNFAQGRSPRRNHLCKIWYRSVKGFARGGGSNFRFSYWFASRLLQHSHTTVWVCDAKWATMAYCVCKIVPCQVKPTVCYPRDAFIHSTVYVIVHCLSVHQTPVLCWKGWSKTLCIHSKGNTLYEPDE